MPPNTLGLWIGKTDKYGKRIWTRNIIKDTKKGTIRRIKFMSDIFQIVLLKGNKELVKSLTTFDFTNCGVNNMKSNFYCYKDLKSLYTRKREREKIRDE